MVFKSFKVVTFEQFLDGYGDEDGNSKDSRKHNKNCV
jgi:hypothetical protein